MGQNRGNPPGKNYVHGKIWRNLSLVCSEASRGSILPDFNVLTPAKLVPFLFCGFGDVYMRQHHDALVGRRHATLVTKLGEEPPAKLVVAHARAKRCCEPAAPDAGEVASNIGAGAPRQQRHALALGVAAPAGQALHASDLHVDEGIAQQRDG